MTRRRFDLRRLDATLGKKRQILPWSRQVATDQSADKSAQSKTFDMSFHQSMTRDMQLTAKSWIKRLGFWGFIFFLVKGLLWLIIPAVIAILALD
jgi:hypothetical protein